VRRLIFLLVTAALIAGVFVTMTAKARAGHADGGAAPYVTTMPPGYRDWKFISVAHEEAGLNSFSAVLGNDVAIKAYRARTLPYPDGTIIVALHYSFVPSEENDKVFGKPQSFVAGAPTNVQFMIKDSKKYAVTGGWGFGHFKDGKPADATFMQPCFPCHALDKNDDMVFTHYAP